MSIFISTWNRPKNYFFDTIYLPSNEWSYKSLPESIAKWFVTHDQICVWSEDSKNTIYKFVLSQTLRTKICDFIKYSIIQAGTAGGHTTHQLVAAVSDTGGPGVLAASHLIPLRQRLFQKSVKDHSSQMIYAC